MKRVENTQPARSKIIEELGLKANVEFKIQTINFGGIVHHMD